MIRQDYILRLVRQFADVVTVILGLKQAGRYEEARQTLDGELRRLTGLSPTLVGSLSSVELIKLTSVGDVLDLDRCLVLAHYLREQADISKALGQADESARSYTKALDLFLEVFVYHDDTYLRERLPAIEGIIAELEPYDLPAATLLRIVHLYEKTGEYGHAEDILYEMLEAGESEESLAEGIALYERLLTRDDKSLHKGNLPREEVEEGLERLRRIREGTARS
ncbi:MAG: DUF6483 family protein [Chloroflexota bacterium]|nr:DUF6483 family protein [Chloroflexota bacterium]